MELIGWSVATAGAEAAADDEIAFVDMAVEIKNLERCRVDIASKMKTCWVVDGLAIDSDDGVMNKFTLVLSIHERNFNIATISRNEDFLNHAILSFVFCKDSVTSC